MATQRARHRPASASALKALAAAQTRPPLIPWAELREELDDRWRRGEHLSIFGPTGRGKTTIALALVERHEPVIFVATKRRDRLIGALRRQGWAIVVDSEQLRRAMKRDTPEKLGYGPRTRRLVFWCSPPGSIRARRAEQAEEVRRSLDYLYARGNCTVVIDEALYVAKNLRLAEELEVVWHEGRASGLSLVACSQRPSWLPKSAYSAPTYLIMFGSNDPDDLKRLADIGGGLDTKALRVELRLLGRHDFVLAAPREVPAVIVRSRVE